MGKKRLPKVPVAAGLSAQDIRNVMKSEFDHYLTDIEWRVKQAYEVNRRPASAETLRLSDKEIEQYSQHTPVMTQGTIFAEDLNLLTPMLTGYVVTPQSPAANQIAWTAVHIVYGGIDYAITDGNAAATDYYCWFDMTTATAPVGNTSTAVMQKSLVSNKPTLDTGDCIIFLNNAGVPVKVMEMNIPPVVANGAVDTGALQANAVTGAKVATGANGLSGNNLTPGANITGTQIASNAGLLGSQLSATANLAGSQLSPTANLVGAQLTAGTVGNTQLGVGAVSAQKMSVFDHIIY